MISRQEYLRIYYATGRLNPAEFPEHDEIRCHALKNQENVIFYNLDTGAVSSALPSLQGLALNPSVIARFVRASV
jgi:hypothetical protein